MSISGLTGLLSFGLGDATLHYVAHYTGNSDGEGAREVSKGQGVSEC